MRASEIRLGCITLLIVAAGLAAALYIGGGWLFNPGPLSAEHPLDHPIEGATGHADFESQCERCHSPFRGPDAALCTECHTDVRDQIVDRQGLHGRLRGAEACAGCHPDHKGRTAPLTETSPAALPHNQFGFTLTSHQRDYSGTALTCRSCHSPSPASYRSDAAGVKGTCLECHAAQDADYMKDHRSRVGENCLACHDGADRMSGFNHDKVYALTQKHAAVPCAQCHLDDRFRGTGRECVQCHLDSQVHRGQFGGDCSYCHTTAGWRPARLLKHKLPLAHGNRGKESACKVCHPANYATYSCYGCHDHRQDQIDREHIQAGIRDYQNCDRCHRTGKRIE